MNPPLLIQPMKMDTNQQATSMNGRRLRYSTLLGVRAQLVVDCEGVDWVCSYPAVIKKTTQRQLVQRKSPHYMVCPQPLRSFQLLLSDMSPSDDLHRSVETLVRYLADRRPKLHAALLSVNITPESQSDVASPLSEASIEELFALPNAPLSALTPEQLLRFAQIVDTALYKSYLIIRPVLLGSLCRVANWCEVSEVEEDLRARKVCLPPLFFFRGRVVNSFSSQKYAELRDLYHGKKMHTKALDLLKQYVFKNCIQYDWTILSIFQAQRE